MKYTQEDVEKWYNISQWLAGITADVFKPKEILIIQDFLETAKKDFLKSIIINSEPPKT